MEHEDIKKNALDLTGISGEVQVEIKFVAPGDARRFKVEGTEVSSGIPKEFFRMLKTEQGEVPVPTPDGRVVFVPFDDIPDGHLVQVVGRFSSNSEFGKEHLRRAYRSVPSLRNLIDTNGMTDKLGLTDDSS